MKFFRLFLILFLMVFARPCSAALVNYVDSTDRTVKEFNAKKIEAYKNSEEFNYTEAPVEKGNLLSLLGYYWGRLIHRLNTAKVGSVSLFDIIVYGLIIFAAIAIVMQFFKLRFGGLFGQEAGQVIHYTSKTEDIRETDFETLIEEAKAGKNFKLATRLFYLKTLKKLSEAGLINWEKNKTNFEYYYELKGEQLRKPFYTLTLTFESAWYGDLEVTEDAFYRNADAFNGFINMIRK
ncbi:MAG: hypothetical protein JWO06_3290 [Bacteroidota bacterium]|nr:hypothetical protein [Bacteroidota bacterium]